MENASRQPSTSQNQRAPLPTLTNYHVIVIPPNPFEVKLFIPTHGPIPQQGRQVMRFQLPEGENQDPPGMLRPPMVNQLPVVHGPSWPFIPGPGIGQPINHPVLIPVIPLTGRVTPHDVRYLNLDATIGLVPGRHLSGHRHSMRLIEFNRQQWLLDYQRVMNQITQLQQSLVALKTRETCLFTPLNTMMTQQFNELPQDRRDYYADIYRSFFDSVQNRIHNSGASDIVGLHVQCIRTSLNCMREFLTPGNALAHPPPGSGVWVPDRNQTGLHIPRENA